MSGTGYRTVNYAERRPVVETARPKVIFSQVTREVMVSLRLPREGQGLGLKLLETMLLIAAAYIVKAKHVLEIGTGDGQTAVHLAANTHALITTVDTNRKAGARISEGLRDRVIQVFDDSASLRPGDIGKAEMVFIDGDHSLQGVSRDTDLAFALHPSVVVWHDYKLSEDVTRFLDSLSSRLPLIHIADTNLVFWFDKPTVGSETRYVA